MKSLLITLAAGAMTLLLSGCPDLPGPVPASKSDSPWNSSLAARAPHEGAARTAHQSSIDDSGPMHHSVSEIAYFQGTIDEAFSRRGCPERHPRRTLFRF